MAVVATNTDHGSAQITPGASSVTIPGLSIGTAVADKLVFITLEFIDASNIILADPSSVTIGGVAANQAAAAGQVNFFPAVYEYWAAVPSGSTASVVVNFPSPAGANDYIAVSVYSVTGADTTSPVAATAVTNTNSTTQAVSGSITVPANGALICGASSVNATGPIGVSWTNATQDAAFSGAFGSDTHSSASSTSATTSTVTYNDNNGAGVNAQIVAVAINPAPVAANIDLHTQQLRW